MKRYAYTRIDYINSFNFHNGVHFILVFTRNIILLTRKFKPPCRQSYLSRNYSVNKEYLPSIYTNKIKNMYGKRLSEFKYNLFYKILCTIFFLKKCELRKYAKCDYCDISNADIKHLIF